MESRARESDIVIWPKRIATSENGDYNRETTTMTTTRTTVDETIRKRKFTRNSSILRSNFVSEIKRREEMGRKEKEKEGESFSLFLSFSWSKI